MSRVKQILAGEPVSMTMATDVELVAARLADMEDDIKTLVRDLRVRIDLMEQKLDALPLDE